VPVLRGSVYLTDDADRALVVVSRNGRTGTALVVELRAKVKLPGLGGLPATVETDDDDPLVDGYILADYISVTTQDELGAMELVGELGPVTLARLNAALGVALGII
jgi:hypothetical protein